MFEPKTDNPFQLFDEWYRDASENEVNDANAMTVATADADGRPSARILLLKDFDEHGFVFYSNFESAKGRDLTVNPFAALCFHWKSLRRQVRITGPVTRVSSPPIGSTLITSAPCSPRIWAANGPATTALSSSTLIPSSGPPMRRS